MKIWVENPKELLGKDLEKYKIEYSRWKNHSRKFFGRLTGRSIANGWIPIVGDSGRPFRCSQLESLTLCRSTGPVDQTNREQSSYSRSIARSTEVHTCTLVHVDRPIEQFALPTVDRSVDRRRAKVKLWKSFWNHSFSDKITFNL